jgi:cytochrome c oxidase subunit 2
MKLRTWVIVAAFIGFIVALSTALYIVREVWIAKAQIDEIDTWSQAKYSSRSTTAELPIEIVGQQFEWRIRYPSRHRLQNDLQLGEHFARETSADQGQADDIHLVNELHLWKGGSVHIHLKSQDVLHSFFVPRMRLKQEAVPGKVTIVTMEAIKSNVAWEPKADDWIPSDEWEFCCGEHTKMRGRLFVHETKADFLKWLKRAEEVRPQRPSQEK